MFRAAFPGTAQKGSALFLAELFLLEQFLGLIEDAAKMVQIAARPKLLLYFSRAIQVLRDGVQQKSWRRLCRERLQSFPCSAGASVRANDLWLGDQDSNLD